MATKSTKKHSKRVEPIFILPDDEKSIESMGYAHGLNIRTRMLFDNLPPGAPCPLPTACVSTMPETQAEIEEMVHDFSALQLAASEDGRPATNNPALFREHYEKGAFAGYRFGRYAFFHGYTELSYAQWDSDHRYELALRFAMKLIGDETWSNDIDPDMLQSVEELQAIHKQYQALA